MNIHEYQAKEVLRAFGAPVPKGKPAFTVEEAVAAAKSLPGPVWVVKAQIHAGGRGKGGGVKVVKSIEEVENEARRMLGMTLVTHQTGPQAAWSSVSISKTARLSTRELVPSALVDRETSRIAFIVSTEGGMDIEAVAHKTPEKIKTFQIEPVAAIALCPQEIAAALGLKGDSAKPTVKRGQEPVRRVLAKEMSLLEINPLVMTKDARSSASMPRSISTTTRSSVTRISSPCATWTRKIRGSRSQQIRSLLHQAGRRYRLHGQWRRASPWPRWTSSSSMAASRPTSWMLAAGPPRKKSPRLSRSSSATTT